MRIIFILTCINIFSCKDSPNEMATKWTKEIKVKIIQDANIFADSIVFNTTKTNINYVSYFNKSIKTKVFGIRKKDSDTILSSFYSKDQKFELLRELCPSISRSFEGIKYEGNYLGITEIRFCDGKLKELGYNFNGKISIWTEWNDNGQVIKETDYGLQGRLLDLERVKYYR